MLYSLSEIIYDYKFKSNTICYKRKRLSYKMIWNTLTKMMIANDKQ